MLTVTQSHIQYYAHQMFNKTLIFSAELFIERFCMTGGNSPIGYLKAYHTNLYLSADPTKVREALEEGQHKEREAAYN